jgi:hypothetical protein
MTRDEIIRLAREAGAIVTGFHGRFVMYPDGLEVFAALVVAAEREACAQVCEETTAAWTEQDYNTGCMDCADAIRARGEP